MAKINLPAANIGGDSTEVKRVRAELADETFFAVFDFVCPDFGYLRSKKLNEQVFIYLKKFDFPHVPIKGDSIQCKIDINYHKSKWAFIVTKFICFANAAVNNGPFNWEHYASTQRVVNEKSALSLLESAPIVITDLKEFVDQRRSLTIYIDETFNEGFFFAVGGIVWRKPHPNTGVLPYIPNHFLTPKNNVVPIAALYWLLKCNDAMPFLFKMNWSHSENQSTAYWRCIETAIAMLFGWLLPSQDNPVEVRIVAEEQQVAGAAPFKDGENLLRAALGHLAMRCPARFRSYSIAAFTWYPKDPPFEYLAWADLLCKTLHPAYKDIFDAARIAEMPCYAEISDELIEQLIAMDSQEPAYAGKLLDFVGRGGRTAFEKNIENGIKHSVNNNNALRDALTNEMASRYREKNRVIGNLKRQVEGYLRLVQNLPDDAPTKVKLAWLAFHLQDANHRGHPEDGIPNALQYLELRNSAEPNHRDQVAYLDAILAVHYNDLFDFEKAMENNHSVVDFRLFDAYTPYTRARALSSLGQSLAIAEQYEEAEKRFEQAILLFREADFSNNPSMQAREIDQTAVYRAINTLDGNLTGAVQLLSDVLGNNMESSSATLAIAADNAYHHHLLVRSLYWHTSDALEKARLKYLAFCDSWYHPHQEKERQHPWELIELYRGLLCLKQDNDTCKNMAVTCFERARWVMLNPEHGATIWFIGGVVAAVALCSGIEVFKIDETGVKKSLDWRNEAAQFLVRAETAMKHAQNRIADLRAIIADPRNDRINNALHLLPFNYR
jgi:hypothetical protein